MIVGISIRNFKAIKKIDKLLLSDFHVLVGANASGKSTFLEAIDFTRDCLVDGPVQAVESRHISNFNDLTWARRGGAIKIGLWLDLSVPYPKLAEYLLHYYLLIEQHPKFGVCVKREQLYTFEKSQISKGQPLPSWLRYSTSILNKQAGGICTYRNEKEPSEKPMFRGFTFEPHQLAIAHIPPDKEHFPTANAVKNFLMQGVRYIQINSAKMRLPCPVTRPTTLELDGTNLARVVGRLIENKDDFKPHWGAPDSPIEEWTNHLRYALPDLDKIGWAKREADNAEYLVLRYKDGLEMPSWLLSDGTLRMLALTLLAFIPPEAAVYMVEEPENGVHPKALEVILQALSSIPNAQMLIATHAPLVVQQCKVALLLCFSRGEEGTQIIRGDKSPFLKRWEKKWDRAPDIATLFANGMLE